MPRLDSHSGGTDERGVTIPRGTRVKVGGMPFDLTRDTPASGRKDNLDMALSSMREAKAFEQVLEAAAGPHMLSTMVLSEKWSDAARAAAAAARRAKSKGGNWRKAAWQTYAVAKGEAKIGGRGRAGSKGQGFDKWAERRADYQADTRAGDSRNMATFLDRHEAIVNTRKQGILDRMRGKDTAAARGASGRHFRSMMDAPMVHSKKKGTRFRRGSLARSY